MLCNCCAGRRVDTIMCGCAGRYKVDHDMYEQLVAVLVQKYY